jgi:hypothetical protein
MSKMWEKYVNAHNKSCIARKSKRHLRFTRHNTTNIQAEKFHQILLNWSAIYNTPMSFAGMSYLNTEKQHLKSKSVTIFYV